MHDPQGSEWSGLCEKLEEFYNKFGGKLVTDSVFDKSTYSFLNEPA